jgi:hypothetical protein
MLRRISFLAPVLGMLSGTRCNSADSSSSALHEKYVYLICTGTNCESHISDAYLGPPYTTTCATPGDCPGGEDTPRQATCCEVVVDRGIHTGACMKACPADDVQFCGSNVDCKGEVCSQIPGPSWAIPYRCVSPCYQGTGSAFWGTCELSLHAWDDGGATNDAQPADAYDDVDISVVGEAASLVDGPDATPD